MTIVMLLSAWCFAGSLKTAMTSQSCPIATSAKWGVFANCSARGLQEVPSLDDNITALDLSHNNITLHDQDFLNFTYLLYLSISDNGLTHLPACVFCGLEKVVHLDISQNKLAYDNTSYPPNVFQPLGNLQILKMGFNENSNNKLTYPDSIFRPLVNLSEIELDTFKQTRFDKAAGFSALVNLRVLRLSGKNAFCNIETIHNDSLVIFNSSKLVSLDLSFCSIIQIHTHAFAPLHHLRNLSLEHNHGLGLQKSFLAMAGLQGRNMSYVNFRSVHLVVVPVRERILDEQITAEIGQYLYSMCVEVLDLSQNHILYFDVKEFFTGSLIRCLRHLNVSSNAFYGRYEITVFEILQFLFNTPLEYLDISSAVYRVPDKMLPKFQLHDINSTPCYIPPTLKVLIADRMYAEFESDSDSYVTCSTSLEVLSLQHLEIQTLKGTLKGFNNLTTLMLGHCLRTYISETFLDTFPSLMNLYLNYANLPKDFMYKHGCRLFRNLTRLSILDLTGNHIARLPKNIFEDNPELQTLILSNNLFRDMPFAVLQTPRLLFLNLSHNQILFLDEPTTEQLDTHVLQQNNFSLDLSHNNLVCLCESTHFVMWIQERTYIHVHGKDQYMCLTNNGKSVPIMDVERLYLLQTCWGKTLFFIAMTLFTFVCLVLTSAFLIMKHKPYIKYIINNFIRNYILYPKREDFKYDICLCYADKDWRQACLVLAPYLEGNRNYRLYLHDRDSIPGDAKSSGILYGISRSWKTILLMSQNFLDDNWSHFTINVAIFSVTGLLPHRLVVFKSDCCQIPNTVLSSVEASHILATPDTRASWDSLDRIMKVA